MALRAMELVPAEPQDWRTLADLYWCINSLDWNRPEAHGDSRIPEIDLAAALLNDPDNALYRLAKPIPENKKYGFKPSELENQRKSKRLERLHAALEEPMYRGSGDWRRRGQRVIARLPLNSIEKLEVADSLVETSTTAKILRRTGSVVTLHNSSVREFLDYWELLQPLAAAVELGISNDVPGHVALLKMKSRIAQDQAAIVDNARGALPELRQQAYDSAMTDYLVANEAYSRCLNRRRAFRGSPLAYFWSTGIAPSRLMRIAFGLLAFGAVLSLVTRFSRSQSLHPGAIHSQWRLHAMMWILGLTLSTVATVVSYYGNVGRPRVVGLAVLVVPPILGFAVVLAWLGCRVTGGLPNRSRRSNSIFIITYVATLGIASTVYLRLLIPSILRQVGPSDVQATLEKSSSLFYEYFVDANGSEYDHFEFGNDYGHWIAEQAIPCGFLFSPLLLTVWLVCSTRRHGRRSLVDWLIWSPTVVPSPTSTAVEPVPEAGWWFRVIHGVQRGCLSFGLWALVTYAGFTLFEIRTLEAKYTLNFVSEATAETEWREYQQTMAEIRADPAAMERLRSNRWDFLDEMDSWFPEFSDDEDDSLVSPPWTTRGTNRDISPPRPLPP